jgi:hypothetical protein
MSTRFDVLRILKHGNSSTVVKRLERTPDSIRGIERLVRQRTDQPQIVWLKRFERVTFLGLVEKTTEGIKKFISQESFCLLQPAF